MADVIVAESKVHGLGVFAARDLDEGETVLIIDDFRVVDEDHPLRPESGEYNYHCDYLAGGKVVLMQLPERHINSSCDPNTFVKTIDGVRHVVARRPIVAGEEITDDYVVNCHGGEVWQCNCGSPCCRGTIVSSFFELPLDWQLAYLPLLDEWFSEEHRKKVKILQRMDNTMVFPRMDTQFAHLALDFLVTGDRELLPRISETPAARHITTHAQTVSVSGEAPTALALVEQLLTSKSVADVDPEVIGARLSMMETDREAQPRCWEEAAAYLPQGALSDATLFLTVGYDIGVAVSGNASLNLAHPHFVGQPEELWFYCVHELHHAGFQRYAALPRLAGIKTTYDLADLVRFLTMMEGLAVHAARRWRAEAGALEADSDYVALLDAQRMDGYVKEYDGLYHRLVAQTSRPLEEDDWEIPERMSTGDRLWYRVGARMAHQIETELGKDALVETIIDGPAAFFDRYAALPKDKHSQ